MLGRILCAHEEIVWRKEKAEKSAREEEEIRRNLRKKQGMTDACVNFIDKTFQRFIE